MRLYFVENDKTIDKIVDKLNCEGNEDLVVSINYLNWLKMKKYNNIVKCYFIEDLFDNCEYDNLHKSFDEITQNWFVCGGKDDTLFEGISFGQIVRPMLWDKCPASRIYCIHYFPWLKTDSHS